MDNVSDNARVGWRRIEVLTGLGRRRKWSDEDKARIVSEAAQPGVVVSVGEHASMASEVAILRGKLHNGGALTLTRGLSWASNADWPL